jgi:hypothetical protein
VPDEEILDILRVPEIQAKIEIQDLIAKKKRKKEKNRKEKKN